MSDVEQVKLDFLNKVIKSQHWYHVLIERPGIPSFDGDQPGPEVYVHELYGSSGSLSWTKNSVELYGDRELLKRFINGINEMLDDQIIFTERELYEFNIDLITDKKELADYLTHDKEIIREIAQTRYNKLFKKDE